jgi:predicted enzyme related to lactoylglutathione lyase
VCGGRALSQSLPVIDATFGHVNLIARDWRRLAAFYERVLGCRPVPPERDYRGADLSAATAVADAALRGMHLRLPGGGPNGPTLEIFQYEPTIDGLPAAANRPGFGHIAFVVSDVTLASEAIRSAGGGEIGTMITSSTADGRRVTWVYVTDPEGNIIELQSWSS